MRVDSILKASRRDPAVVIASLGANMLSLVVPVSMIHLYDRIIPNNGLETLAILGLIVLVAIIVEGALRAARREILERAGETFEIMATNAVFEAILRATPSEGDPVTQGRLSRSVSAVDRLRGMHTGDVALAILDLPFALIFFGVIALISPLAGAIIVSIVLFAFAVLRFSRRNIQALQNKRKEIEERRHSFLSEALAGVDTIKGMHIENAMERRYERLMSGAAQVGADIARATHRAQGFAATVGAFAPILVACAGAFAVLEREMTIGALAAVILLTGRIIQPVLRVEAFLAGMVATGHEREDLEDMLVLPGLQSGTYPLEAIETIELRNVSTAVSKTTQVAFQNIDVSLRRGDCIHLIGGDACARTAFLSLLLGEADVTAGEYLLNELDSEEYRLKHRQHEMAYLSSSSTLLSGTLLDNLTAFRPRENRDAAMELTRALGIDKAIATSAHGYDLKVGSGAKVGLSSSLADAVVIAGGLVNDPSVVLFDQANASLDRVTDERLLELLLAGREDRITIICSNRPSYQRLATQTFDISKFVVQSDQARAA